MGEAIAARFLTDHDVEVVGRNLGVGKGEIDLLAIDDGVKVVAEVRSVTGDSDPIDAVDRAKRLRVRRLAGQTGADRVDFIGVRFGADDVVVHWVPGCD